MEIKTEENGGNMATSGAITVGDLALLADTNRAGRGNGYWGGEGGVGLGVAGPVFQHSQDSIKQSIENSGDCTRALNRQGLDSIAASFENQTRAGQFNQLCDRISQIDQRNTDNQFRAELRTSDQLAALKEKQAQDAAAAALCCCKLEAQAAQNYGELKAQNAVILAKVESNKEISELRAQLQTQELLAKTNNGCGVGTVPCNPCS